MISPQNLAIGAAAVGLAGREGDLFRKVLGWSLALVLVMCVLVYLQSTAVLDWMVGRVGAALVSRLEGVVGDEHVITHRRQLATYESDGLLQYASTPAMVVLPGSADEVAAVVRACHEAEMPWTARGAGSGLSGGAMPWRAAC